MSDLDKVAVSTKGAPAAIGPYSQAIWVGDLLFASGQVALDPATGQIVAGGITEQTTRVLENVKAVLALSKQHSVLSKGKIIFQGETSALVGDEKLIRDHLAV